MGRYTDIAFRGLEVPVVESSVHKHQTVLGAPVVLVDLLAEGFAQGVRREPLYGQQVFLFEIPQVGVDVLRGVGPSGALAQEDELLQRRAPHTVVVFEVLAPHRVVDLDATVLTGLLFVDEVQVPGQMSCQWMRFTSLTRRPIVQAMIQNRAQRYLPSCSRCSIRA